jgi:hypothetical protein
LRSPATILVRIASLSHLLSSKVNASMMCCCSTSDWLTKNCRAWL